MSPAPNRALGWSPEPSYTQVLRGTSPVSQVLGREDSAWPYCRIMARHTNPNAALFYDASSSQSTGISEIPKFSSTLDSCVKPTPKQRALPKSFQPPAIPATVTALHLSGPLFLPYSWFLNLLLTIFGPLRNTETSCILPILFLHCGKLSFHFVFCFSSFTSPALFPS